MKIKREKLNPCDKCDDRFFPCFCRDCSLNSSFKDARLLGDVNYAWDELEGAYDKDVLLTNVLKAGPGKGGAE